MNKIEFINNEYSLDNYVESFNQREETSTESSNFLNRRNSNSVLKSLLTGALLFTVPIQESLAEVIQLKNNSTTEYYLNNYLQIIDLQTNNYIEQVNKLCSIQNYSRKEIIREIIAFKSLKNNWDGFSAIPLEIESATNAIIFVEHLGERLISKVNELYPNPNGTISFIWSNKSDETISIEIGNNTMSYYVELNSQEPIFCNNISINDTEIKKIAEFVQML